MITNQENYTPELKARLILILFTKERTVEEVSEEYGIPKERLWIWRRQFMSRAYVIFEESNQHRNLEKVNIEVEDKPYLTRLKMIRKSCGYSQKRVGEELGIAQDSYARYENGVVELPVKRLIILCRLFGVSSDYMLGMR